MPASAQPSHYPLPPATADRLAKARQAHALNLAEARVGSKWWLPLKILNQQVRIAAMACCSTQPLGHDVQMSYGPALCVYSYFALR